MDDVHALVRKQDAGWIDQRDQCPTGVHRHRIAGNHWNAEQLAATYGQAAFA
ncbi:hypothetical protein D9M70_585250 [compost metagenome]